MKLTKTKTLVAILTAAIILLISIVAMASDPPALLPRQVRQQVMTQAMMVTCRQGYQAQTQDLLTI